MSEQPQHAWRIVPRGRALRDATGWWCEAGEPGLFSLATNAGQSWEHCEAPKVEGRPTAPLEPGEDYPPQPPRKKATRAPQE